MAQQLKYIKRKKVTGIQIHVYLYIYLMCG